MQKPVDGGSIYLGSHKYHSYNARARVYNIDLSFLFKSALSLYCSKSLAFFTCTTQRGIFFVHFPISHPCITIFLHPSIVYLLLRYVSIDLRAVALIRFLSLKLLSSSLQ